MSRRIQEIQTPEVMTSSAKKIQTNINGSGCHIIFIYATWCGACHAFMPQWKEFEKTKPAHVSITKIESNALQSLDKSLYKSLADNDSMYFPMVIIFINGKKYHYHGVRTASDLHKFVEQKSAQKPLQKPVKATAAPKAIKTHKARKVIEQQQLVRNLNRLVDLHLRVK